MIQILRNKAYRTLRWSEQYLKTDMIYLTKGGFWLVMLQIISALSGLALSIAFARLLPKESYGIYKYILSVAGVIGAFSLTGLTVAVTRAIAKGEEKVLRWAFGENLKWSFGIVLISVVGAAYYFIQNNIVLSVSLVIVGVFLPILNSSSLFSTYFSGKKLFKQNSLLGLLRTVFPIIALIGSGFISSNPLFIIFVYFFSNTLISFLLYLYTIKKEKLSKSEVEPETLSYSKHLSLMSILNIIADNLDKIIIFQFIGAAELAVYVFATALPTQIKGVFKNAYTLAFPKFATKNIETLKKTIPGMVWKFTLATIPVIIAYVLVAPYLYNFLFPQYAESILFSQVFSISLLFYSSVLMVAGMQSQNMVGALYKTNIYSAITKILLVITLGYLLGVWGVIISRVLYELFSLIINSFNFFRASSETTPA